MDILNWVYLIKNKLTRTTVQDPQKDLVILGNNVSYVKRGDKYQSYGMTVQDFAAYVNESVAGNCPIQMHFKPSSVGEKVSFKKAAGSDPNTYKDVIIPGLLEITRGNGGGIYNIAIESSFNSSNSPENTMWSTKYNNPTLDGWAPLWDFTGRTYDKWRDAIQTPEGNYAPPQYVGMPVVMKYDNGVDPIRYWLIIFTEWGVGAYGEQGAFAYDRYEIYPSVTFTRPDYEAATIDILSPGVHIARDSNGGQIYNAVNEPDAETGVSPRNTRWNSIYTDSRAGYSGYTDLSNLESRVYTDFALALDAAVGNNVLDTDLIMHDMTTDLYYKVNFSEWTSNGNGGGFEYTRTVIPQSCGIKFADQTVLNTSTVASTGDTCCYTDTENNLVAADSSNNTVSIGPGGTHDIPNFSGMVIVNDHNDGGVEMWLCGGGPVTVLVSSTIYGPGPGTMTINGGIGGYTWTNVNNQAGPFTFTVIKTRNQA